MINPTLVGNVLKKAFPGAQVSDPEIDQVLFFTGQLSDHLSIADASRVAHEKGWIDASGRLTPAGAELLHAFRQQSNTRSVFRPMC